MIKNDFLTVKEVAELLGVSKKTIYRKIDILTLMSKGHVKVNVKGQTIDNKGVELIRLSLCQSDIVSNVKQSQPDDTVESYKLLLQEQKELYIKMLEDKDQQIEELKKDKEQLRKSHENTQILLARQQDINLRLEEPKEIFEKEIREERKQGFFTKLFKKY